jgi:hypothetical protein
VAVFCDRFVVLGSDHENARGSFDDVVSDRVELVDLQDATDLWEEPFEVSKSFPA